MEPIFLVSMPRAGSTLLQRLLMGHPQIGSCGEPWLALPLAYMLRDDGIIADYGHRSAMRSVREFVDGLPGGESEYWQRAAEFLRSLYAAQAPEGVCLFVDKTPRYYKIIAELRQMFPDAPIVILLRNPLSVFASMLNFVKGDLRYMPMWQNDWEEGHGRMVDALTEMNDVHLVRFESLVQQPDQEIGRLMGELGLEFDPMQIEQLSGQQLSRGDPTGVELYQQVDTTPLSSWKASINSITKKRLALRWLRGLPEFDWTAMGYDKTAVLAELVAHQPVEGWSPAESLRLLVGRIYFHSGAHLLRRVFVKGSKRYRPFFN